MNGFWDNRMENGRLRVMFVVPGNPDGSGLPIAVHEADWITKLGVRVYIFYLRSRTSPAQLIRECFRFRREVVRVRPHLIHAQFGTATSFFCALCSRLPLVITFRGSDLHGDADCFFIRSKMSQLLSQLSCLAASSIICVSSELRDRLWWRKRRASVLCSGTDLEMFCPQPKDQSRAMLGWETGVRVVVFAGQGRPKVKGLRLVEDAVRVAEKLVGAIRLEFLKVPFTLMPCCLNAADCLALGSVAEGSPNIVREALACNLPIVATSVGDVPEVLKDVHPSAVVRRDPEEFGFALAQILAQNCRSDGRHRGGLKTNSEVAAATLSRYEAALKTRRGKQPLQGACAES